ncbi:MAG: hypothetical protein H0X30_15900 [Anaerolineae bacterium]|nr:hypothetical protein [Anaerolineae bacterium]
MSKASGFGAIHEIFGIRPHAHEKELNAYLGAGWVLADIHQRSYRDPQTDEEVKVTVYIMGHTDSQAVAPKWDPNQ